MATPGRSLPPIKHVFWLERFCSRQANQQKDVKTTNHIQKTVVFFVVLPKGLRKKSQISIWVFPKIGVPQNGW